MQHAIVRAFIWAGALTLLLAIGGGVLLGGNFVRRIDTIGRTSRAIMEGDLSARIPVRGNNDEIDQLVVGLNAMLDRIQQLLDGLRQVSSESPTTCAPRSAVCARSSRTRASMPRPPANTRPPPRRR